MLAGELHYTNMLANIFVSGKTKAQHLDIVKLLGCGKNVCTTCSLVVIHQRTCCTTCPLVDDHQRINYCSYSVGDNVQHVGQHVQVVEYDYYSQDISA
jgi:hypothetical protein